MTIGTILAKNTMNLSETRALKQSITMRNVRNVKQNVNHRRAHFVLYLRAV